MTIQPIAFRMPELRHLDSGRLNYFRRMADGILAKARPGDLCWIREPFFLPASDDHRRPSTALALGIEPTFLDAVNYDPAPAGFGRVHAARELCRPWHRRHLRITQVERQHIQDIPDEDIWCSGYRERDHFRKTWDRDISMRGLGARWQDNPSILRFAFELIDGALPPPESQIKRKPNSAWKPSRDLLALRDRTFEAFGTTAEFALGSSQGLAIVRARDAAHFVLKAHAPELTLAQLAAMLGGRDHTASRDALKRAKMRRENDRGFRIVTDDMIGLDLPARSIGRLVKVDPEPPPRFAASRPAPPKLSFDTELSPPLNRHWCDQCEQLVDRTRAAACGSRFCKAKPKELTIA